MADNLTAFINLIGHDYIPIANRLQVLRAQNLGLQPLGDSTQTVQQVPEPQEQAIEVDVNAVLDAEPLATRAAFMDFLDTMVNSSPSL